MKIISEENITEAAKDHAMYYSFETDKIAEDSFRCGAEFAEKEFMSILIDFGNWVSLYRENITEEDVSSYLRDREIKNF